MKRARLRKVGCGARSPRAGIHARGRPGVPPSSACPLLFYVVWQECGAGYAAGSSHVTLAGCACRRRRGRRASVGVLVAERYRLDEPLGRGAMGEVWRATDQALGRPVAVKLLRADDGDAAAERLRMEAQTAARLNHPHVVSMYDSGCHDGRFYLVMELVDGWSLAQELAVHGLLDPQEAGAIGAQMAAGLSAAHLQGVIHRDIKPGNIMLTTDRIVKITDFGIARFADDASHTFTATGKILGTGSYLAPERAVGSPAVPASDVYALGCVLYELLTGRPLSAVRTHRPSSSSTSMPPPSRPTICAPRYRDHWLTTSCSCWPRTRRNARPPSRQRAGSPWKRTRTRRRRPARRPRPSLPSPSPCATASTLAFPAHRDAVQSRDRCRRSGRVRRGSGHWCFCEFRRRRSHLSFAGQHGALHLYAPQ